MGKHEQEIELTRRLLLALGGGDFVLNPRDRPDVKAAIGGRCIGIEVTVFHGDEGLGCGGSVLRANEEKAARRPGGGASGGWVPADPLPSLTARIRDKVSSAEGHDRREFTELWLLIVAQLPKFGAVASTFALSAALNVPSLNQQLHNLLAGSAFDQAYLHLSLEQAIYVWNRSGRWLLVKGSLPAPAGSELWFKSVLRDPEWLRDPADKSCVEAQKVLDELAAQRRRKKEPRADC